MDDVHDLQIIVCYVAYFTLFRTLYTKCRLLRHLPDTLLVCHIYEYQLSIH